MNFSWLLYSLLAAAGVALSVLLARKTYQAVRADPRFWAPQIRRFQREDERDMPPPGGILFTGSSSIRYWNTLAADMAPLPVIGFGFGGSMIHQVPYYADRIIFPYKPRLVVLYAGENDIAGLKFARKRSPEEVLRAFQDFWAAIHTRFPGIPIIYLSIKPPRLRKKMRLDMKKANQLISAWVKGESCLKYVDVASPMLNEHGQPRPELYRWDGLHMTPAGYAVWTGVLKLVLLENMESGRFS